MKAVGLVVEYNPFHNGHAHHVKESLRATRSEVVVAVMSGPFLQRGEPALVPKQVRASMALEAGVDLVIELPYAFAVQKADFFAHGAINLLHACGCETICFGSELGRIEPFYATLDFLSTNNETYQAYVKKYVHEGVSYPKATALAFSELTIGEPKLDLTQPNNILGYQYVKAIMEQNLPIKAYTISRKNASYHDRSLPSGDIASATSIRKAIFEHNGNLSSVEKYFPSTTYHELEHYFQLSGEFMNWENYWPLLQYKLLSLTALELQQIYEVSEGIEHRLIEFAHKAQSFHEFMTLVKTKRYTWTRLQRICIHILTGVRQTTMESHLQMPKYIRLLGMTENGKKYLNKIKKHSSLPIISKLSSIPLDQIEMDIRASRIYSLGTREPFRNQLMKWDYLLPPIYKK